VLLLLFVCAGAVDVDRWVVVAFLLLCVVVVERWVVVLVLFPVPELLLLDVTLFAEPDDCTLSTGRLAADWLVDGRLVDGRDVVWLL